MINDFLDCLRFKEHFNFWISLIWGCSSRLGQLSHQTCPWRTEEAGHSRVLIGGRRLVLSSLCFFADRGCFFKTNPTVFCGKTASFLVFLWLLSCYICHRPTDVVAIQRSRPTGKKNHNPDFRFHIPPCWLQLKLWTASTKLWSSCHSDFKAYWYNHMLNPRLNVSDVSRQFGWNPFSYWKQVSCLYHISHFLNVKEQWRMGRILGVVFLYNYPAWLMRMAFILIVCGSSGPRRRKHFLIMWQRGLISTGKGYSRRSDRKTGQLQ